MTRISDYLDEVLLRELIYTQQKKSLFGSSQEIRDAHKELNQLYFLRSFSDMFTGNKEALEHDIYEARKKQIEAIYQRFPLLQSLYHEASNDLGIQGAYFGELFRERNFSTEFAQTILSYLKSLAKNHKKQNCPDILKRAHARNYFHLFELNFQDKIRLPDGSIPKNAVSRWLTTYLDKIHVQYPFVLAVESKAI